MQPENPAPSPGPVSPSPEVVQPRPTDPAISRADTDMLEPGEHLVTVVHRHPIGIVLIYLETLVGIGALIALAMIIQPSFISDLSGSAYMLFIAAVVLAVGLIALILFVATYLYSQSRLLVTNRSLVQIIQKGLFNRKVSRLSMADIEDVNVEMKGFLSTILNFGTLNIETAGEMENFNFPYCPKPNFYADRIIEARQAFNEANTE